MNKPNRPSEKELKGKLDEAKDFLSKEEGLFANPGNVTGELYDLDISDSKDVWCLIQSLIEEIKPKDYTGGRPPLKSYEKSIVGKELFAFVGKVRF